MNSNIDIHNMIVNFGGGVIVQFNHIEKIEPASMDQTTLTRIYFHDGTTRIVRLSVEHVNERINHTFIRHLADVMFAEDGVSVNSCRDEEVNQALSQENQTSAQSKSGYKPDAVKPDLLHKKIKDW